MESSIARARCTQGAPIPVRAGAPGLLAQVLQGGAHYLLHLALRAQHRAPQSDASGFLFKALCAPYVSFLSAFGLRLQGASLAAWTTTLWMSMHGRKPAAACTAGMCCGRASTSGAAGTTPSTTRGARPLMCKPSLCWPLHHCPPDNIDICVSPAPQALTNAPRESERSEGANSSQDLQLVQEKPLEPARESAQDNCVHMLPGKEGASRSTIPHRVSLCLRLSSSRVCN